MKILLKLRVDTDNSEDERSDSDSGVERPRRIISAPHFDVNSAQWSESS